MNLSPSFRGCFVVSIWIIRMRVISLRIISSYSQFLLLLLLLLLLFPITVLPSGRQWRVALTSVGYRQSPPDWSNRNTPPSVVWTFSYIVAYSTCGSKINLDLSSYARLTDTKNPSSTLEFTAKPGQSAITPIRLSYYRTYDEYPQLSNASQGHSKLKPSTSRSGSCNPLHSLKGSCRPARPIRCSFIS